MNRISRREAIIHVSTLLGGTVLIGASGLVTAASLDLSKAADSDFSGEEITWLDEVAETVLPETATPGAKAAGVGPFMALMVTEVYSRENQQKFRAGIQDLEQRCMAASGGGFLQANADQRLALLNELDAEQHRDKDHYFRMMKQLILFGYFTSEIGCTQAQRYVETPGRWEPCLPYEDGETSWAAS